MSLQGRQRDTGKAPVAVLDLTRSSDDESPPPAQPSHPKKRATVIQISPTPPPPPPPARNPKTSAPASRLPPPRRSTGDVIIVHDSDSEPDEEGEILAASTSVSTFPRAAVPPPSNNPAYNPPRRDRPQPRPSLPSTSTSTSTSTAKAAPRQSLPAKLVASGSSHTPSDDAHWKAPAPSHDSSEKQLRNVERERAKLVARATESVSYPPAGASTSSADNGKGKSKAADLPSSSSHTKPNLIATIPTPTPFTSRLPPAAFPRPPPRPTSPSSSHRDAPLKSHPPQKDRSTTLSSTDEREKAREEQRAKEGSGKSAASERAEDADEKRRRQRDEWRAQEREKEREKQRDKNPQPGSYSSNRPNLGGSANTASGAKDKASKSGPPELDRAFQEDGAYTEKRAPTSESRQGGTIASVSGPVAIPSQRSNVPAPRAIANLPNNSARAPPIFQSSHRDLPAVTASKPTPIAPVTFPSTSQPPTARQPALASGQPSSGSQLSRNSELMQGGAPPSRLPPNPSSLFMVPNRQPAASSSSTTNSKNPLQSNISRGTPEDAAPVPRASVPTKIVNSTYRPPPRQTNFGSDALEGQVTPALRQEISPEVNRPGEHSTASTLARTAPPAAQVPSLARTPAIASTSDDDSRVEDSEPDEADSELEISEALIKFSAEEKGKGVPSASAPHVDPVASTTTEVEEDHTSAPSVKSPAQRSASSSPILELPADVHIPVLVDGFIPRPSTSKRGPQHASKSSYNRPNPNRSPMRKRRVVTSSEEEEDDEEDGPGGQELEVHAKLTNVFVPGLGTDTNGSVQSNVHVELAQGLAGSAVHPSSPDSHSKGESVHLTLTNEAPSATFKGSSIGVVPISIEIPSGGATETLKIVADLTLNEVNGVPVSVEETRRLVDEWKLAEAECRPVDRRLTGPALPKEFLSDTQDMVNRSKVRRAANGEGGGNSHHVHDPSWTTTFESMIYERNTEEVPLKARATVKICPPENGEPPYAPPFEFFYTNRVVYDKDILPVQSAGCDCEGDCKESKKCSCRQRQESSCRSNDTKDSHSHSNHKGFAYDDGVLSDDILAASEPIWYLPISTVLDVKLMSISHLGSATMNVDVTTVASIGCVFPAPAAPYRFQQKEEDGGQTIRKGTPLNVYAGELLLQPVAHERDKMYTKVMRNYIVSSIPLHLLNPETHSAYSQFDLDCWHIRGAIAESRTITTETNTSLSVKMKPSSRKSKNKNKKASRSKKAAETNVAEAPEYKSLYSLDAFHYGNWTRFCNHECQGSTAIVIPVYVDEGDVRRPLLVFFARQDIEPGRQITISYYSSEDPEAPPDAHGLREYKKKAIKCRQKASPDFRCYCGKELCRGFMFGDFDLDGESDGGDGAV
ncbi:hypothetical protein P7C70_g2373, partial [Phenoliferia sp. Uapishka_3]